VVCRHADRFVAKRMGDAQCEALVRQDYFCPIARKSVVT
jgi:hypothetical protein